jgi:hypothetical protein
VSVIDFVRGMNVIWGNNPHSHLHSGSNKLVRPGEDVSGMHERKDVGRVTYLIVIDLTVVTVIPRAPHTGHFHFLRSRCTCLWNFDKNCLVVSPFYCQDIL